MLIIDQERYHYTKPLMLLNKSPSINSYACNGCPLKDKTLGYYKNKLHFR